MTSNQDLTIEDLNVPVLELDFMTEADAYWLAVECLLVSEAKKKNS